MRPIAIIISLLMLGLFPSATASQTNPYQPFAAATAQEKKDTTQGMKLGPKRGGWGEREKTNTSGRIDLPPIVTIAGSLATVIGIFLIVAWLMRRATPRANMALPEEVVEVLGRAPLTERQHVHLLRCGGKLLLVSVTPDGAETLTEITDAGEVERLSAICRQNNPGGSSAGFRQVFQQLSWGNNDE